MISKILLFVALAGSIGGCEYRQRMLERILEHAELHPVANPEPSSTFQPQKSSLLTLLPSLRKRASTERPETVHAGWELFRFEGLHYGRYASDPTHEFVASKVEVVPGGLTLTSHSVLILGESTSIENPEGSITTIKGIEFSISGQKEKSRITMPSEPSGQ
ncbi:MAG TPA: hypothetical protein PLA50_05875 [Bacteroidia bacterium]|nr:hypothetical protein [Bacteroidia bacterium]